MFKAAVLTVSDRSFRGERPDAGGPLVVEILKNAGYAVTETAIVPDEKGRIEAALRQWWMELDKDNWQAVPDKDRLTVSVPPEAILLLES